MSGHVETVTVSRCGDWHEDLCPGDEHGCTRCLEEDAPGGLKLWERDLDNITDGYATTDEIKAWRDQPHPTELTHRQFLQEYGRCPDGCEVAEQLEIAESLIEVARERARRPPVEVQYGEWG